MDEALYTVGGYLATPQPSYCLVGVMLNCPHPGQAGWLGEVVSRWILRCAKEFPLPPFLSHRK